MVKRVKVKIAGKGSVNENDSGELHGVFQQGFCRQHMQKLHRL
jgi:hypothetical protein